MVSESIEKAMGESERLTELRRRATKDVAVTLYVRKVWGDKRDTAIPCVANYRPQDFATNPDLQYRRVVYVHLLDGEKMADVYLIHLYWDGGRDYEAALAMLKQYQGRGA